MKKLTSKLLPVFALLLIVNVALAQKPKIVSGDPADIAKIKSWDVDVEFNNPKVHKQDGDYAQFLAARVKKMNETEEDAGTEWKEKWDKNINRKYNSKFCLLMNKYLAKSKAGKVVVGRSMDEAKGKIVVKTYWIYLGYVNPMIAQPSKVSSKIHFLDGDGKELLVVDMVESPGQPSAFSNPGYAIAGFGFNPEGEFVRMTESFAKCGKDLAGWLLKKAYSGK